MTESEFRMADADQKSAIVRALVEDHAPKESGLVTQFKASLAGMNYQQQVAAIQPDLPIQFLGAVQMTGSGFIPEALAGTTATTTVSPFTTTTADPKTYTGTYDKYKTNWTTVMGRIRSLCSDATVYDSSKVDADIGKLGAKKDNWYDRWGRAALSGDEAAAGVEFQAILTDMKSVLPQDTPESGGGHLYTGRAGGSTGRQDAEASAGAEAARSGVKHTTLEQTVTGQLFDGINGRPPDHIEWGDVVAQWWSVVSADYASSFQGNVICHAAVGVPYFMNKNFKSVVQGKSAAEVTSLVSSGALNGGRQLDRGSVFAKDELKRLAQEMAKGAASLVTNIECQLRIDTGAGIESTTVNIAAADGITHAQILSQIDAGIASKVTDARLAAMANTLT